MMVDAIKAYQFVNTHAPIYAQVGIENGLATSFWIMSQAVYPDGSVKWESDSIAVDGGKVDLLKVREILGY